MLQHS